MWVDGTQSEEYLELRFVQGFLLHEPLRYLYQLVAMPLKDFPRSRERRGNEPSHFGINLHRHDLGIVSLFTEIAAKKDHLFLMTVSQRAEFDTHSVLGDHLPG